MLQCWHKDPAKRPTFDNIKQIMQNLMPQPVKATNDFSDSQNDNVQRLTVKKNDLITVIDGNAQLFWWKGQNHSTFEIGFFPRLIVSPLRPKSSEDISVPLRNSFIHTGKFFFETICLIQTS